MFMFLFTRTCVNYVLLTLGIDWLRCFNFILYIRNLLVNILPQCGYAYEIIVLYVNSTDCLSGKRFHFEVKTVFGHSKPSSQLAARFDM